MMNQTILAVAMSLSLSACAGGLGGSGLAAYSLVGPRRPESATIACASPRRANGDRQRGQFRRHPQVEDGRSTGLSRRHQLRSGLKSQNTLVRQTRPRRPPGAQISRQHDRPRSRGDARKPVRVRGGRSSSAPRSHPADFLGQPGYQFDFDISTTRSGAAVARSAPRSTTASI